MAPWALILVLAVAQSGEDTPEGESQTFDIGFGEEAVEPPPPEGDAPDELPKGDAPPIVAPPPPPPPPDTPASLAVLVPTKPVDMERGHRIARAVTNKLAAARGQRATTLVRQLDGGTSRDVARTTIESAKDAIDDGIRAFEELDLENAGVQLEIGVNQLLSYRDELKPNELEVLDTAIFAYGATVLFEGQSVLANAIFVALAVTSPDFEPSDARYPSNVRKRFRAIVAGVPSRATGTLRVETVPTGGAVFVDGLFKGFAPLDIAGLPDGWHQVRAERVGYHPYGTLAPVRGEASSSVSLELEASDVRERVDGLAPNLASDVTAVERLREELGVETLVALRYSTLLSGDKVEGVLVAAGEAPLKIGPTGIVEDPEVASATILAAFEAQRAAVQVVATAAPTVEEDGPVTDQWWFWATVGGVVVAAAAAGTVAAVAATNGSGPPSNSTVVLGF
ncbi:MAG: PEGA domain-containing protein [Deltaproteobacteria bacterium]|jgi:hypothetical protein